MSEPLKIAVPGFLAPDGHPSREYWLRSVREHKFEPMSKPNKDGAK